MKRLIAICAVATMLAIGSTANAHWDSNMPYKMHYPQLPDPLGWDVSFSNTSIADDWKCSETGPVKDIHFWASIKGWNDPEPPFESGPDIMISIRSNIAEGPEGYSVPGNVLWARAFVDETGGYEGEFAGYGNQGWLDPLDTNSTHPNDHQAYYLVNINNIDQPFQQEKDAIYWLEIAAILPEGANYEIGWKTSENHWNDDAVYLSPTSDWQDLHYPSIDPRYPESIDMAFVIAPEPATICLLGLGAALLRRNRR